MTKFGPHGGCTDNGAYPFGTCSLKRAADPKKPRPADDADFDSWVSGVKGGGNGASAAATPDEEGFVESRQMVDSAAGRAGARRVDGGGGGGGAAAAAAGKHAGGP